MVKKYPWQRWPAKDKKEKKKSTFHGQRKESSWKKTSIQEIRKDIQRIREKRRERRERRMKLKEKRLEKKAKLKEERLKKEAKKAPPPPPPELNIQDTKNPNNPNDEKWIREAIEEPGSYRASVQRRYGEKGFTERGTIRQEVIAKDAEKKGRIGKQARLARTLHRLRD